MTYVKHLDTNDAQKTTSNEEQLVTLASMARSASKPLYYFIFKQVGNESEAEDLVQQAFEQALRNIAQFRGDCSLVTWVYSIATNLIRNHLNRSPNRVYEFDSEDALSMLLSEQIGPEEQASQTDVLSKLNFCVNQLPEEMRSTIMMVLVDEESYSAAARTLNVPIGTIRSRICRARKILKEQMDNKELGETIRASDLVHQNAVLPRMPARSSVPTNLAMIMNTSSASPVNAPFLGAADILDAYRRLDCTYRSLVAEMRKGATPQDFAARRQYLEVIESAMQSLQKSNAEATA